MIRNVFIKNEKDCIHIDLQLLINDQYSFKSKSTNILNFLKLVFYANLFKVY